MAQLTDLSDILTRRTGYLSGFTENIFMFKTNNYDTTMGPHNGFFAGQFYDLWFFSGSPPTGGTPTSTATLCDNTTSGAIPITNPPVGTQKWLTNFNYTFPVGPGLVLLYDRLCHVGGLHISAATTQTINTPTLSRYSGSSSVGNRIMGQVLSSTTISNPITMNVSYTNQDGVSGRITQIVFFTASNYNRYPATSYLPPLVSGDTGVRSIESVTCSGVFGGASGVRVGLAIIRPLEQSGNIQIGLPAYRDPLIGVPNVPEILSGACLSLLYLNYSTLTGTLNNITGSFGYLNFVNK